MNQASLDCLPSFCVCVCVSVFTVCLCEYVCVFIYGKGCSNSGLFGHIPLCVFIVGV